MEDLWTDDFNFSVLTLLFVLILTAIPTYLLIKRTENILKKMFLLLLLISFFVYSGIGISILNEKNTYLTYYAIYLFVLVFSLYFFRNLNFQLKISDEEIGLIIEKHSSKLQYLYLFLLLTLLVFPENKLHLLFSPPRLDLSNVMDNVIGVEQTDIFTSIVNVLMYILLPLYYMSLIKYKQSPVKLFFFIFVPVYLIFCKDSYVSRTMLLLSSFFYIGNLVYFYPNYRKRILFVSILLFLFSISFLAAYTLLREGETNINLSFGDAVLSLFVIEGTFPSLFNDIYIHSINNASHGFDYVIWLITQPLPGFLKSGFVDMHLNQSISGVLLGVDSDEDISFVLLTGLVTESVFVFGRYFFFLHALILGVVLNLFLNFILSKENFKVLVVYTMVFTGLAIGRSGTSATGVYPYMLKAIVYLPLILYLLNMKISKK